MNWKSSFVDLSKLWSLYTLVTTVEGLLLYNLKHIVRFCSDFLYGSPAATVVKYCILRCLFICQPLDNVGFLSKGETFARVGLPRCHREAQAAVSVVRMARG